jgi:hypothetical protein
MLLPPPLIASISALLRQGDERLEERWRAWKLGGPQPTIEANPGAVT